MKRQLRRTLAAALAMIVVAGFAPSLPFSDYLPDMGITAYAVDAEQSGENDYMKFFVGTGVCYYEGFSVQGKKRKYLVSYNMWG